MLSSYPLLKDCAVRGSGQELFLQNYLDGKEYALSTMQARALSQCDGSMDIVSMASSIHCSPDSLVGFFESFEPTGLLNFSQEPSPIKLPKPLEREPYLQEVQIEVTGKCNLWCGHCYARQHFADIGSSMMSLSEIKDVLSQMFRLNIGRCFLTGGEVFTRKDVPEIIRSMKDNCVHVSGIFTNGTIYREDILDALRETGMKTRLLVSIDGNNAETHEAIRGRGTFSRSIAFLHKVIDAGFSVTVNTMVVKPNAKNLIDMREFLEDMGVFSWRVSVPREQGEMLLNRESLDLPWTEVFRVYKGLLTRVIDVPGKMRVQIGSIFRENFLRDGRYYVYHDDSGTCQYKRWSVVLSSNGDVLPCPAGVCLNFGSIRSQSLEDIWYSANAQTFKSLPISATGCSSCDIRQYCGGGCRINAKRLNGSYLARDDDACTLYRFFAEEIRPILEQKGVVPEYLPHMPEYLYNPSVIDLWQP